jgi:hypothetical protein
MKLTLDKIEKVDLNLSKEIKSEILKISHSLETIINKNIYSKKTRLYVKIKSDSEVISCKDISIILDKSNTLLTELL